MAMIVAKHFGRPRGLVGRVVGRIMARSNAGFSRWVVEQLAELRPNFEGTIVELGFGPGIGLQEALLQFPRARLAGVDVSSLMLSQAGSRNRSAVAAGRLTLVEGDAAAIAQFAPVGIAFANHVLYFWHQPETELHRIHDSLAADGVLALGYQLRRHMPRPAQTNFPAQGHLLYESETQVEDLLAAAGFTRVTHRVMGTESEPEGRLAIALV